MLLLILLGSNCVFSQENQTNIVPTDSIYVSVKLSHIIKSNQAYIEVKSLRKQLEFSETAISQKDKAFQRLLDANNLSHNLNKEYEVILKADRIKQAKCEEYAGKIEFQNKQLVFQSGFLKIGTPIIAIAVGAGGFALGYYINQLIK